MDRRRFLQYTATGFAVGQLLRIAPRACAATPARRKPNIVYVLTDQWRAQATGYAGDPNVKTPQLDSLASQSVNFKNAVSVCPVCTPYRASLLTGRYPLSTGMFMNDLYFPSEELCMAEIYKKAGYDTGYIGKWHLDGHGRDSYIPKERRQGFDHWQVLECTHSYNKSHYYDGEDKAKRTWKGYDAYAQTKEAQKYIRDHAKSQKPFLLMISYGGPHFPHHTAPKELQALYPPKSIALRPNVPDEKKKQARKEAQGYYAHCTALDRCVGDLLATLQTSGLSEDTIFVFTSDHGEMLGSQGHRPCGKQRPWDESVCVPFLLRYPATQKKRTLKAPINTPDILPTLLSLSGIRIPDSVEGADLSGLITGKDPDTDRAALFMAVHPFAGYHRGKAFRGIRTSRYTYVRSLDGPWLLYDNQSDPYQRKNLVGVAGKAELQKKLERQLQAKLAKTKDAFASPEQYRKEWGYTVDSRDAIPYRKGAKMQTPRKRAK